MMFRTIIQRKTFAAYSLVPDKYIHITRGQLRLEISMLNLSSTLNSNPNSVASFVTLVWNSLSTSTRKLSRKQFKEKIHNAVLKILAAEDNYIDRATLLQRTRGLQ